MKDGVRILNFARGALVKDTDLIAALESGKVSAYITDFPTDAVIGVEGVTALPHLGASTPESEDNCAVMAAEQIDLYLSTGSIKNSVNMPNVILPEISPGIVTGGLLAFTMSLDDFVISFFTSESNNLSMLVYAAAKRGVEPTIYALSTLMFIAILILLIIINKRSDLESIS